MSYMETRFLLGELPASLWDAEQAVSLYDPAKQYDLSVKLRTDPRIASLAYAGISKWLLGYPDQALDTDHTAFRLVQNSNHPTVIAFLRNWMAILFEFRGEWKQSQYQAEEAIFLSTKHGISFYLALGKLLRGRALIAQGQAVEGREEVVEGMQQIQSLDVRSGQTYFLALLAEAYGQTGAPEKGLGELRKALDAAASTRERFFEAELYRVKGELILQTSAFSTEAEECFHKAIEITRNQEAKSLELRATISLARLWHRQGKNMEARKMLGNIYGWFSEGFDTKDLQEAKRLLELSWLTERRSTVG